MAKRELIKTDRNGTKYWNVFVPCDRCGGTGIYRWGAIQTDHNGHVIGSTYAGTCFKCGGAARVWETEKEYTPEYRAKLDAANEKRKAKQRAKWEAERAEREREYAEQRKREAEERARREAERRAEIERNRGNFIGAEGDKIEMTVTLDHRFSYEVPHPVCDWKKQLVVGYVFKTDDNNTLVWKTTSYPGHFEDGTRVTVKGTIKAHEEFNNVNQTILTRVKIAV